MRRVVTGGEPAHSPLLRSAGSRQASRGSCSGARVSPHRAPPALQRWRPLSPEPQTSFISAAEFSRPPGQSIKQSGFIAALPSSISLPRGAPYGAHRELSESWEERRRERSRLCAFQSRESGGRHGGVHLRGPGDEEEEARSTSQRPEELSGEARGGWDRGGSRR